MSCNNFLKQEVDPNTRLTKSNVPILLLALKFQQYEQFVALIFGGANLNLQDSSGGGLSDYLKRGTDAEIKKRTDLNAKSYQ